jgi:hypothetical protein
VVRLLLHHCGGICHPARPPFRCGDYRAGPRAQTRAQEQGVPHTRNSSFDECSSHERGTSDPEPDAAFCVHLHLLHGVWWPLLLRLSYITFMRGDPYEKRSDRFRYAVAPFIAYVILFGGGVVLFESGAIGLDLVATGMLMVMNLAIRNSWSIAISIISSQD